MSMVGWGAAVLGSAFFLASLIITVRACPVRTVPLWRAPVPAPPHSVWTRIVGILLLIPSGLSVGPEQGLWLLLFYAVVLVAGIGIVVIHNRRVTTGSSSAARTTSTR